MSYPPKSLSKKNTIEKAGVLYKTLADSFKYFKQSIDRLKDRIDQLDLNEQIYIDNLLNSYDTYLSDLANSLGNLLLTRKDIIGDDGSLLIRPVNKKTHDYTSEIWHSYTNKCDNSCEIRFPSRVVCRYDNFSLIPLKEGSILNGYQFLIGKNCSVIKTSGEMLRDIINESILHEQKIIKLLKYLSNVTLVASYLQDYCLSNEKIINDYLDNFKRIFMSS